MNEKIQALPMDGTRGHLRGLGNTAILTLNAMRHRPSAKKMSKVIDDRSNSFDLRDLEALLPELIGGLLVVADDVGMVAASIANQGYGHFLNARESETPVIALDAMVQKFSALLVRHDPALAFPGGDARAHMDYVESLAGKMSAVPDEKLQMAYLGLLDMVTGEASDDQTAEAQKQALEELGIFDFNA